MAPDLSRNPADYRPDPGGHFLRKKKERNIPGAVIRRCIESGDVEWDRPRRAILTTTYMCREWTLVVDPVRGYVITGYRTNNDYPDDPEEVYYE